MRAGHPQDAVWEANFIAKAGEHLANHFEPHGFALGPRPLLSGFLLGCDRRSLRLGTKIVTERGDAKGSALQDDNT